ncbi:MAG: hypothetical protein HQ575_07740, partial [Candidatus Omnitrophica bacterium]|nr:hypothetical protein [Candidatus Omnitrophota bacterium]
STQPVYFGSTTAASNFTVVLSGSTSSLTISDTQAELRANLQFTGTGAQTITHTTGTINASADITVNKASGTLSLGSAATLGGDLTLTSGTFATTGYDLTVSGTFANNATLQVQGGETLTFTKDTDSGLVEYLGSGSTSYTTLNYGNSYNDLSFNSTSGNNTWALTTQPTVGGTLYVKAGTVDYSGYTSPTVGTFSQSGGTFTSPTNMTFSNTFTQSGGIFTTPSGTMTVEVDFTLSGGTFTDNTTTFIIDATSGDAESEFHPNGHTFNNDLTFKITDSSNNTITILVYDDFGVNGDLTVTNNDGDATLIVQTDVAGTYTATIQGDLLLPANSGKQISMQREGVGGGNVTYDLAGATSSFELAEDTATFTTLLKFSGTGAQTLTQSAGTLGGFTTITVDKASGTVSQESNVSLAGNLTLTNGTFATAGYDPTVTGTFANNATFQVQGGEDLSGITLDTDSGTVEYVGSGSTSYASLCYGNTYNHVTFNSTSGNNTWSADGAVSAGGNMTLTGGIFAAAGNSVSVTGIFANNATLQVQGGEDLSGLTKDTDSGTVAYVGSGGTAYNSLIYGNNYFNLTINSTSGTNNWTPDADVDVDNNFAMSGGIFTAPTNLNVGGNLDLSAGTFTHNSGTVILDDAAKTTQVSGSATFNNLTSTTAGKTIQFTADTTQTIAGTLTITGASGNLITLNSTTSGTQWKIDPQGDTDVSFVDVKDSENLSAAIIDPATSTDSGNNTNWFPAAGEEDAAEVDVPNDLELIETDVEITAEGGEEPQIKKDDEQEEDTTEEESEEEAEEAAAVTEAQTPEESKVDLSIDLGKLEGALESNNRWDTSYYGTGDKVTIHSTHEGTTYTANYTDAGIDESTIKLITAGNSLSYRARIE